MKKSMVLLSMIVLVFALVGIGDAILIDCGGGLIYDSRQDITWLQDAIFAGRMTWEDAIIWAGNFCYYDTVRDKIWEDWRLPTAVDFFDGSSSGFCSASLSETGTLFYTSLGTSAGALL